jgi:putative ABC transport system substrate-binding protein
MIASTDPRQVGASSLARPSGHLTGLAVGQVEVFVEKQLDLLKAAIPGLARVLAVWDVNRLGTGDRSVLMAGAARALSLQLQHVDVGRIQDFESAFRAPGARSERRAHHRGPAAIENRRSSPSSRWKSAAADEPVESDGRGRSPAVLWPRLERPLRRASSYVDRILKGAGLAICPSSSRAAQLVLNLRTAKALGLTIPQSLVLRADQVIE